MYMCMDKLEFFVIYYMIEVLCNFQPATMGHIQVQYLEFQNTSCS